MWRILIGLGCVPACCALYFRLTIPETPRFTMDIERNVTQAAQDVDNFLTSGTFYVDPDASIERVSAPKASKADFLRYFSRWENGKLLLGTAYSWFALDVSCSLLCCVARDSQKGVFPQIAFYGLGLNSSIILQAIGFGTPSADLKGGLKVYTNLKNICVGNMILSAAGLIPGYWASFLFIDSWGRKPIQLMGFSVLTVLFCCMGFGYKKLIATPKAQKAFVFLYCLANFFQNFGPNTTTFIIPGEAFPTRYRSTGHGISAASGKLGAVIAQVGFARLKDIHGTNAFVGHMYVFMRLLVPVCIADRAIILQPRDLRLLHVDRNLLDTPHPRDQGEDARRRLERDPAGLHPGPCIQQGGVCIEPRICPGLDGVSFRYRLVALISRTCALTPMSSQLPSPLGI